MNPGEKIILFIVFKPDKSFIDDFISPALDISERYRFVAAQIKPVKIIVKALINPPFRV